MEQQCWYQMNNAEDISYGELANRNSKVALKVVQETRDEMLDRMNKLEARVAAQSQEINILQHRYDLLLTANFNGGSTSDD